MREGASGQNVVEPLEARRLMSGSGYVVVKVQELEGRGGAGLEGAVSFSPGVNDKGWVVGTERDIFGHATVRLVGKGNKVTFLDMGNFDPKDDSDGRGVNDLGQVVGSYSTGASEHAFVSQLGKKGRVVLTPLGDVKGLNSSIAYAINDKGTVVAGTAGQLTGKQVGVAWLAGKKGKWAQVVLPKLADKSPIPGIDLPAIAVDVNDSGVIVGQATTENLQSFATAWLPGKGGTYAPVVLGALSQDIGMPLGSYARAINDRGLIVGSSIQGMKELAVVFTAGKKGRYAPTALPALKNSDASEALDVNDDGVIVGTAHMTSGDDHAVMWVPGRKGKYTVVDLNTYLKKGSTDVLEEATGVASDGTIVGVGSMGGDSCFILTTNPAAQGAPATVAPKAGVFGTVEVKSEESLFA